MQQMPHIETFSARSITKPEELIEALERSRAILAADIEREEQETQVFETTDPRYSPLARQLRARCENLTSTISTIARSISC